MKKEYYRIVVELESGEKVEFDGLEFEKEYTFETDTLCLNIDKNDFLGANIKVNNKNDYIKTMAYK